MSSGVNLINALDYLQQNQKERKLSENFRNVCNTLRKTNSSLSSAWDGVFAAYTNVCTATDEILSRVYVKTNVFATQTIENEKKATEAAESFNSVTSSYYDTIINVCNKYGISGND